MHILQFCYEFVLNSYSQIFFSRHKHFAWTVLAASFLDAWSGFSGLLCVFVINGLAILFGLSHQHIKEGTFGFNALLVGLFLGSSFQPNLPFFLLLFVACLLTLLFTVMCMNVFARHNIPFLSLPFTLATWFILLAIRGYHGILFNETELFFINRLYGWGGMEFLKWYKYLNEFPIPIFWASYLKSLGAILFQHNLIAGSLLAGGLFLHSRIAFSLSVLGFAIGYYFYSVIGGDLGQIHYQFVGFNFILSAIAIGGFFLIPSWSSFILVALFTPIIALLISSLGQLVAVFQLPIYALPFFIVVALVLFFLRSRYYFGTETYLLKPIETQIQHYSPEKNLYQYINQRERFENMHYYHVGLPFYGNWKIWQGYDGKYTHKNEWKYALDFVIMDLEQKTYRGDGKKVEDYYCYNLPVVAPAYGVVVNLEDGIDDNEIGEVYLTSNWGNSIVIKHYDHFYTQLSHIKKGSFKVAIGDYVTKGQILALNGNSGRSPEPHIHFQLQTVPYIGASPIAYPFNYYMKRSKLTPQKVEFLSFTTPLEGDEIENVITTPLLSDAFYFAPNHKIKLSFYNEAKGITEYFMWEVLIDSYNQSYLYCETTQSSAYFVNNGILHYFTTFYGDKTSPLYYFYLATYKVFLGYYQDLLLTDTLPINSLKTNKLIYFQDAIAPFHIFIKKGFSLTYQTINSLIAPTELNLSSQVYTNIGGYTTETIRFEIAITQKGIEEIKIQRGKNILRLRWQQ